MTQDELNQKSAFLFNQDNPIWIKLYFVLEIDGVQQIRFADISPEVALDLKREFLAYLDGKLHDNPELHYGPITEADDSDNSVYYYNLEGQPEELHPLYEVYRRESSALHDNPPFDNFSFHEENDLSKITAFVICLGNEANRVVLYKKHYPVSLMKRGSYYGLIPSQTRFEKLNDNVLKVNKTIEFLLINGSLIVFSLKTFQNSFGYDRIIHSKAEENLVTIDAANLLEDIDVLRVMANELKFAKKIMKIRHHSPVLQIPFNDVREFIQNHPKLKRRIRFNQDETRISLKSQASRELFIKLLNDDFLKSELTQLLYDSQKKAALDNMEAEGDE